MSKPDVVWYWIGGRDRGRWNQAFPDGKDIDSLILEIERMGYIARKGKLEEKPEDCPWGFPLPKPQEA